MIDRDDETFGVSPDDSSDSSIHGPAEGIPRVDLDPYSESFLRDPLRFEEELRDLGPVVWLERYGVYALARFDEVSVAMNDWETFSSARGVGIYDTRRAGHERNALHLLEMDPPDHTALRQVHNKVLNPKFIRTLRESFDESARTLISGLVGREVIDAASLIATAYPLSVFPDMIGVDKEGRENLLPAATFTFNAFGPENWLFHETAGPGMSAAGWLAQQATAPAADPDGVAARTHAVGAELGLEPELTMALVFGLLTAGLDTTMNALGHAIYLLATNPSEWAKLKAEPSLARPAFEEAVRLGSPVQTFARHTTREVEVGGMTLPADAHILLFLGSANRDPRHWPEADRYDISRSTSGHVGFGAGVHSCAGQMVARMEGTAVLTALADQAEHLELAGTPEFALNNSLRGFKNLPVRLT